MDVRELLSRFGACAPQPADDWRGDIPLPDQIARFYEEVGPLGERGRKGYDGISLPGLGNDIQLVPLADLWKEQAGYRWDGHSGERIPEWPESWIVVAWEGVDAYILDTETGTMHFGLPGADPDDTYSIAGSMTDVIGALALVCLRHQEAGDDATDEDFALREEWIETMRAELAEHFGTTADGIIEVFTAV